MFIDHRIEFTSSALKGRNNNLENQFNLLLLQSEDLFLVFATINIAALPELNSNTNFRE